MSAGESVEQLLHRVAPGRYDAYEALLTVLTGERLWMLLWQGSAGSPDARYGKMEVGGHGYVPCVTSESELAASGWSRSHEVTTGREIASVLYPGRWGIWLNPHAPGGGLGIPWLDLRRMACGLDVLPAGPLRIGEPALDLAQFYGVLTQNAHHTPVVRSLRRAWVQPALGSAYLAIGVELYDSGPHTPDPVRSIVQQAAGLLPTGLPVATVAMSDEYDPVVMWLRAHARPFFDRDPHTGRPPVTAPVGGGPGHGYGYPRPY